MTVKNRFKLSFLSISLASFILLLYMSYFTDLVIVIDSSSSLAQQPMSVKAYISRLDITILGSPARTVKISGQVISPF